MLELFLISMIVPLVACLIIPTETIEKYNPPKKNRRRWFSSSSSSGKRPYGLPWMGGTLKKKDRYL